MEKTPVRYFDGTEITVTLADGANVPFTEWTFTADENDHLSRLLADFDDNSRQRFSSILEELCRLERRVQESPRHSDVDVDRANLELQNLCKKAAKALKKVSSGKRPLIPLNKVDHDVVAVKATENATEGITLEYQRRAETEWWSDAITKATRAHNALLDFLDCFTGKEPAAQGKAGRPKADDTGFVKQISNAYALCFGTPTTRYSNTFKSIVQFALEAAGKTDFNDPTRKIKRALSAT